jgi:aryl-alcohol dehydrogenase-like predicted oxidoreductase
MRVGLGGGALGRPEVSESDALRLLDAARALEVALVDAARSYGAAEERIGRWRAKRRDGTLPVVTKGGYGIRGVVDWTGAAIVEGVEHAVARLGAIDTFLLHSCPAPVLDRDDVRRALERVRQDGDVARVGYSGDNDDLHGALDRAAALGLSVIEQSLSLLDGRARVHTLPRARAAGHFVVAKRALANAPWRAGPLDADAERQRARFTRAALPDVGLPWDEVFLRFAAYTPGVDVVLVGTARPTALERAVRIVAEGPLPADVQTALAPALARCDDESIV